MKTVLVTGGTTFVSRYVAEYYVKKNYKVYVLNRNHHPQPKGVALIEGDRKQLQNKLAGLHFDVIFDITAYTGADVTGLLDGGESFDQYILISTSAVYPPDGQQPFTENSPTGVNMFWESYGAGKQDAEGVLLARVPDAYVIRPPYFYGPMNNLYREAFVFDCAQNNRKFYIPKDGAMRLQFFYVEDLCAFMDVLIEHRPAKQIYNVGNIVPVSVKEWVRLCYKVAGKTAEFVFVEEGIDQRSYFPFHPYEYYLDVKRQHEEMHVDFDLEKGLQQSFAWYKNHASQVQRQPYMEFIDRQLANIRFNSERD